MKVPPGMTVPGNPSNLALKILRNLYGQRQVGKVWHNYLIKELKSIGYRQSEYDPCILYKGQCICLLYTDGTILFGPDSKTIDARIKAIRKTGLKMTDKGNVAHFL